MHHQVAVLTGGQAEVRHPPASLERRHGQPGPPVVPAADDRDVAAGALRTRPDHDATLVVAERRARIGAPRRGCEGCEQQRVPASRRHSAMIRHDRCGARRSAPRGDRTSAAPFASGAFWVRLRRLSWLLTRGRLSWSIPAGSPSWRPSCSSGCSARRPSPPRRTRRRLPPEPTVEPTPASPPPTTGPSAAEVEALQQRIEALESQVDALQREQAQAPETEPETPAPAEPAPAPAEPAPEKKQKKRKKNDPDEAKQSGAGDVQYNRPPDYADGFHFGSYGRVMSAHRQHRAPGAQAGTSSPTALASISTPTPSSSCAARTTGRRPAPTPGWWRPSPSSAPIFHYNGNFNARFAVRNLYIEETGLGLKRLTVWAGSRMYRGDDIYLLNFWPLDNLNTVGGGAALHVPQGSARSSSSTPASTSPTTPSSSRWRSGPLPLNQLGDARRSRSTTARSTSRARKHQQHLLDRQHRARASSPSATARSTTPAPASARSPDRQFENAAARQRVVAGAQLGAVHGQAHHPPQPVLPLRAGLAAYGEFDAPTQLNAKRTSKGAHELLVALGGNYEIGAFGVLLGAYFGGSSATPAPTSTTRISTKASSSCGRTCGSARWPGWRSRGATRPSSAACWCPRATRQRQARSSARSGASGWCPF